MNQPSSPEIPLEPKENDENESPTKSPQKIMQLLSQEPVLESPIDINITKTIPVEDVSSMKWVNYESVPKKMKITNTGHTVILSGKWGQERPYITDGILTGKYVFSQMHLHWGITDMEGSEHTIDGSQYPGEMHVVTFKSSYLTQESALKETDGIVILVYIFRLQDSPNRSFQTIANALPGIVKAHTSVKIIPIQLCSLLRQFDSDYFLYRGSVSTSSCVHHITWLLTRIPIGVSSEQVDSLRFLMDNDDELIKRNFRPPQPISDRTIFHVLPSSSKYSTLLPLPDIDSAEKTSMQVYSLQLFFNNTTYFNKKKKRKISMEYLAEWNKNCKISQHLQHNNIHFTNQIICMIEDIKKYMNSR